MRGQKIIKTAVLCLAFQAASLPATSQEKIAAVDGIVMADILLPANRFIVRLSAEINDQSADDVIAKLRIFAAADPKRKIDFWLDSGGGYVQPGMRIRDTIASIPNPVDMFCGGKAKSMAAILFLGHPKSKGQRIVFQECAMMTHAAYMDRADGVHVTYMADKSLVTRRHEFAKIIASVSNISFNEALKFVRVQDKDITLDHARRLRFFDVLIPKQ